MIFLRETLGIFFEENYLPTMKRYNYHQPHFVIIGKNVTSKDRNIDIKFGYVETTIDYVERLKFEFDNEIMCEHFENSWSLLIEGYSSRFFPNTNNMEVNKKNHNTLPLTL